jgi:hypothetical protein
MGLDANGNFYNIVGNYGGMTDAQKDDANRFAHQFPNGSATASAQGLA